MPSNHPRLKTLPADLFAGLRTFRDLEERISALPDGGLQRGDALEIFVEAHLQTHPLFQVEELWLVNQIPMSVRGKLKLHKNSKGIDGVYRKNDGSLAPYQVKFRQGRPQVGVGDTSSFFMLTESADQRVLISNCDRYAKEIRDRDGLLIIGGSYFDDLAGEEFARIEGWLKSKPIMPRRERPMRTHQAKAVQAIIKQLRSETRTTAVMPCGTGKTLVGLRAVEALKPKNVVVFVPSLALLAQLLEDWAKDTIWGENFRYLCVCSQPAVSAEVDRWELSPTDVHFPVMTDPAVVRSFLEHDSDKDITRVIFSTYQSAKKVAEGLPRGFRFDVGLFDEAHKTTEGGFGLALDDKQLLIDRRLFLTATPRHVDIRRRDKAGDFKVVSMDNPEIYGHRAFSQSFAEAVAEGTICDYRVVVAAVDRSEISEHAERYGITLVQDNANATRWVASQIAVAKAIEKTGASKLVTFHSRVHQAKDFASDTPRGISQFLPDFEVGHVNGTQPVTDRKDVLKGFRKDGKILVTNARCLTEGVDLPAVDAVVFNNPRRSKVDIVQAVGRAMRKPPNSKKQLGYVVIPVLLERSETKDLEESCRGTEWEDLVAVVAALRDHDSRLEEMIREAREAAGRGEVFAPRPFGDSIAIIGRTQVALKTIQHHVHSVILERLGQTWDYRYGQLVAHTTERGNCNVSPRENKPLSDWTVRQRKQNKQGLLSPDRISKLNTLGFAWDPYYAQWEERYRELEAHYARSGNSEIPWDYHDPGLYNWISNQRTAHKRGCLSVGQIARLDHIGFIWDPFGASFEKLCSQLRKFKEATGHCNVPARSKEFSWLGAKLAKLKEYYRRRGNLDKRGEILLAMGVVFNPFTERFEERFARLATHHKRYGNCNIGNDSGKNSELPQWMAYIRARKKQGKLSAEQIARLDTLGFIWSPKEASVALWKQRVAELKAYIATHGDSNVPLVYLPNQEFANWWRNTRSSRNTGKLNKQKERELDALSVTWSLEEAKWNSMFEQLKLYKKQFGDCKVPHNYAENPKLGSWVGTQVYERRKKIKRRNTAGRVQKLVSIGFWDDWAC